MATLYFKVESDLQKVKDLRAEISRLEAQMKSFGRNTSAEEIKHTEERLTAAKSKFTELANEAAKAGAVMESGFKKKVYEASQTINSYTEKIIEQKSVIKGVENDVRKLSEAYGRAVKNKSPKANGILQELNASKEALNEEKAALFGLTQEQSKARLSVKKLRDEYAAFKGSSEGMTDTMDGISAQIKKWGAGLLAGYGIKEFASQVIRVRGEFQQMETSIKTLVGESKANELIPQIKEMAKVSPLTMSDIVGAEQMMLGFNIAADDTVKYLRALSDVSMGNSQKFNSLTLAFSQMSAAGKLMGQDLNQMINAGFNPLQAISDKTGKSIAQLKKEMSSGAISAEMVQQAFIDATSAGGKFYKMSEEGSKTINGQISMMEDAMDSALNEIGKSSEGLIMTGIKSVTKLIENYETVGVVLTGLVATYGLYKAALIANIALEKTANFQRLASIKGMTAQALAVDVLTKKLKGLAIAKVLTNPYIAAGVAITGATIAAVSFFRTMNAGKTSIGRVNEEYAELNKNIQDQREAIQNNIAIIQDENQSNIKRAEAYEELKKLMPQLTGKYTQEQIAKMGLTEATKAYNKEVENELILLNKRQIRESQQRIQKLKIEREAFRIQGNEKGYELRTAQIKEEEESVLAQLLAIQDKYRKANQQAQKEDEIKNKEYWEKKKQAAQARLEAMESSAKGSADWLKLEKEIAQYQKEIDKYSTSKTTKAETDINKQDAKKKETLAKIQESKKAIIEAEKEAQFEIRQASINAMKEGTDKELEQINLDYDKKLAENEKRREQFVKDIAEQMALQWEVENPNAAQKGLSFDKSKVTADDLTPEQKQILEFYDLLAQKEKMLAQSDVYEELLNKYKTYNQKRKEVEEQYNKDRAAMKNSDGTLKPGFSEDNIRVLDEQKKTALSEIDLEFAMKEEQFRSWARSIASLSLSELNKMLNNARRQLGNMITSNRLSQEFGTNQQYSEEDIARLRAQIAALEAETKDIQAGDFQNTGSSSGIEGLINSYQQLGKLQNAINDAKKDGTDETKVEALEQLKLKMTTEAVGASVKMLADGMSKVSAFMKECAELSGDIELGNAADQIGALSQNLSAAGQGAASGGWIGAIVGGATDLITQLTEGLMNIKRIKAQWEDFFDDFNHELKLLKYEINDADYDAIFGTNIIGKLNDSISAAKGAYDDYIAHVEKSAEVTADASGRKLNWGVGFFTADIMNAIGFGKKQNNLYLQQVDALKRGLTELQGMSINTTNYSGFLKLFGKEDKYKSLIDIAPELWDEAGNFNVENAKIFLETNKMITDTQREQIQEVIDIYEQYEDAMANINDYLSGIFQDTASTIADRMIDAFTRTGDAMTDLEDLTSQVASNMAKDLIEALLLDQYLAPAMDRIKGLYDPQSLDYEEDATKRTQSAIQAIQDGMDAASSAIPEVNKLLAALQAAGWDVASATEQTASYGGFETMSEDTGSEPNGRFTALQLAGEEIKTQCVAQTLSLTEIKGTLSGMFPLVQESKIIADEIRSLLAASHLELQGINENTSANVKELKKLGLMFNKWDSKIMNL